MHPTRITPISIFPRQGGRGKRDPHPNPLPGRERGKKGAGDQPVVPTSFDELKMSVWGDLDDLGGRL